MAIRLVKEEAEEQLGLSFFCSGHSRWHPHWTKHTYTPGESPAFTHQAASVRRAAERRHRRQPTLLLCLSRGQECPQQEPGPEGLRMFQDNSKCHEEAVFLLSIKKETSPGAEQSLPPEMRYRESVQRQAAGTSQVPLCFVLQSLLCARSCSVSGFLRTSDSLVFIENISKWYLSEISTWM